MAEPRPIRLRETPNAAPNGASVIDARYEVVGKPRGVLGKIWTTLIAAFWVALAGSIIPPALALAARLLGN